MEIIEVKNLKKDYKRKSRKKNKHMPPNMPPGMPPNMPPHMQGNDAGKSNIVRAVNDISFSVSKGEIVGYIGSNGAGKSTTIKMLTGILVPTSGDIYVNGIIPYKNRKKNAKNIGVVFGQRTQLWWDLPVMDSFNLLKHIYDIPKQVFNENMQIFTEVLGLHEFLYAPVRQLSLGQRMRADIAAALLHNPPILFLDEPTIGLDPFAKEKMREFIKIANKERGITVILTTHDMSDIEDLSSRVVIIEKGQLAYDDSIQAIKQQFGKERVLEVEFIEEPKDVPSYVKELKHEGNKRWYEFNKEEVSASKVISDLLKSNEMIDFSIKEKNIEAIVKKIYRNNI